MRSDRFAATLDPVSGAVSGATFEGSVVFEEPGRRAFAGKAVYEDGPGLATLTGDPRIVDEGEGSELRGRRIRLGTRTRTVAASDSVRHTITTKQNAARTGLLGGDEPAVLLCREFEYDPRTRTDRYRENALLRSGKDEVRAPTIVIEEGTNDTRRLTASGGTTSILHPRPRKDAAKFEAQWELRFGPQNRFRVFYKIVGDLNQVYILAIGEKKGNKLFIGGEEIEL